MLPEGLQLLLYSEGGQKELRRSPPPNGWRMKTTAHRRAQEKRRRDAIKERVEVLGELLNERSSETGQAQSTEQILDNAAAYIRELTTAVKFFQQHLVPAAAAKLPVPQHTPLKNPAAKVHSAPENYQSLPLLSTMAQAQVVQRSDVLNAAYQRFLLSRQQLGTPTEVQLGKASVGHWPYSPAHQNLSRDIPQRNIIGTGPVISVPSVGQWGAPRVDANIKEEEGVRVGHVLQEGGLTLVDSPADQVRPSSWPPSSPILLATKVDHGRDRAQTRNVSH